MHVGVQILRSFAARMIFLHMLILCNLLMVLTFDGLSHSDEMFCSTNGLEQNCILMNLDRPVAFLPSFVPIFAVLTIALIGSLYNIIFSLTVIFLVTSCTSTATNCIAFVLGIIPYLMVITSKIIVVALFLVAYDLIFETYEVEFDGVFLFISVAICAIFLITLIASNTTSKAVSKMLDDLEDEVFSDNIFETYNLRRPNSQSNERLAKSTLMLKNFLYYFGRDRHPEEM